MSELTEIVNDTHNGIINYLNQVNDTVAKLKNYTGSSTNYDQVYTITEDNINQANNLKREIVESINVLQKTIPILNKIIKVSKHTLKLYNKIRVGTLQKNITHMVKGNINTANLTRKQKTALQHLGALSPSPSPSPSPLIN